MITILFVVVVDAHVLEYFSDVIRHSGMSSQHTEAAAFLVRKPEGMQCLMWPQTNEYERQTFDGAPPAGTVAIVHTHPRPIPKPSPHDIDLARALGLPMFVLTPGNVSVYDPAVDTTTFLIENQFWSLRRPIEHCDKVR